MLTKKDILRIARNQLALDYNCQPSDFEKSNKYENTIVTNKLVEGRRIYDSDGCFLKVICFLGTAVFCADAEILPWLNEKMLNRDAAWLFEASKLRTIDEKLHEHGQEIADIHMFYLPRPDSDEFNPNADIKWYEQEEIQQFKDDDRFEEAFAFEDSHPDVLAIAALDGDKIMGMAGASADSNTMWQIGIDVLPEYRGRRIGTRLVKLLKNEILKRGKVPFYSTVQSHFHSQNIALNAGFFPAWMELYSEKMKKQL